MKSVEELKTEGPCVSSDQFGAVALMAPNPTPVINLPTINCGNEKLEACKMDPRQVTKAPSMIVRLLPSTSPIRMQDKAPNRAPRVYVATTVP